MRWEPGTEHLWADRVDTRDFRDAAHQALAIADPTVASEAFEELCIGACRDVGILRRPRVHNPNQDGKHLAEWFDAACRAAKSAEHRARALWGRHSRQAREARNAFRRVAR